jgi:hypothetical protein
MDELKKLTGEQEDIYEPLSEEEANSLLDEEERASIVPKLSKDSSVNLDTKKLSLPEQALEQRRSMETAALISGLGERLAQGLSTAGGQEYKPDYTFGENLRKLAESPVRDIKDRSDLELNDPNSDISKLYRDVARDRLKLGNITENVSAATLAKLIPNISSLLGSSGSKSLRFERITTPDGTVKVVGIDPLSGEIVREVGQAGFATQFRTDPFGNIIGLDSSKRNSSPQMVQSSNYESAKDLPEEKVVSFKPDKEQRKAIDNQIKRYDKITETVNRQLSSAQTIQNALKEGADNQQLLAFVKTQMPRLAGEVGNLNTTEQEIWQGSQAAIDRIEQYLTTLGTGKLTKDNIKIIKEMVDIFSKNAARGLLRSREPLFSTLEQEYGIPRQFVEKSRFPKSGESPAVRKLQNSTKGNKTVVKKGYNPKTNQTQLIYSDGTKEIVEGRQ